MTRDSQAEVPSLETKLHGEDHEERRRIEKIMHTVPPECKLKFLLEIFISDLASRQWLAVGSGWR